MATVYLGNNAPVQAPLGTSVKVNGESDGPAPEVLEGKTIVVIQTPDTDSEGNPIPLDKKLTEVRNAFAVHSAGSAVWVEGHDDFFNQAVAQVFGAQVGRPADWDAPEEPQEPVSTPAAVPTVDQVEVTAQDVASVAEVLS